ncbi:hypothetical protein LXL04_020499 [Taraxacum kok-saghyz]
MDRVLETVAAFPAPATDEELNNRLSSIVEEVVKKQLTATEVQREERLKVIEEALHKNIKDLNSLLLDIAQAHGFEIAERDQRIQDLERIGIKSEQILTRILLSEIRTSISGLKVSQLVKNFTSHRHQKKLFLRTREVRLGAADLLRSRPETVSRYRGCLHSRHSRGLLKTTTDAFDSFSKELSLSTSSLLDGISNLKLDEAVPRSTGRDVQKLPIALESTKPELVIDLEKEPTPKPEEQEKKESTPPTVTNPKGKSVAASAAATSETTEKPPPPKTADPTQA